jgi:hypothetical protein
MPYSLCFYQVVEEKLTYIICVVGQSTKFNPMAAKIWKALAEPKCRILSLVGVQYADSQGGCARDKALSCLQSLVCQLCLGAPEGALSM